MDSVGAFCVDLGLSQLLDRGILGALSAGHSLVSLALGLLALGASILHLGRPRYAFRVFLGLRTSWLSREILLFAAFASLACVIHAWRRQDGSLLRRSFWSVAAWVPLLGPIFYVTMYRVPPKSPDSEIPESGHQY